jgi:hypothetical protein
MPQRSRLEDLDHGRTGFDPLAAVVEARPALLPAGRRAGASRRTTPAELRQECVSLARHGRPYGRDPDRGNALERAGGDELSGNKSHAQC